MNASDYQRLAATCDRLLGASGTCHARLAIGFLHLIHEHPSWLAQYRRVFDPAATPRRDRNPTRGARDLYRMARGLYQAVTSSSGLARPAAGSGLDALIVSHVSTDEQLAQAGDFYFGAMPELLRARGASVLVALVDHRNGAPETGAANLPSGRLLLQRSLPLSGELKLWNQCAAARASLTGDARAARDPFDGMVARVAAEQALSANTAANLRLHARVREICASFRPRIVMTTFEGDASERMIFLAARQSGGAPLCVGYQHTRILPRSHAIRRAIESTALRCDPDVVLTLGAETQAMLESASLGKTRFIAYGSHRRTVENASRAPGPRGPLCLVLPDAESSEHALLFEFAVNCARRSPGITFVFRSHPIASAAMQRVRSQAPADLPANFRVDASQPLQLQAAEARCCLYRASSAAIHAVLAGARPLYLSRPQELSCDPLAAMPLGGAIVSSPEDVAARMQEAEWTGSEAAQAAWNYCNRYVEPVRPSALDELLLMGRTMS